MVHKWSTLIRECINKFGVINSCIIPRAGEKRRSPTSPVVRAYEIVSPRTCSVNTTYTTRTYNTRVTFPGVRVSYPRHTFAYLVTHVEGARAVSEMPSFSRGASVKVAITRVYIANGIIQGDQPRVRSHTRAHGLVAPGLFRRQARIRAETKYMTHNSTNSITKFQVIPVPDLSSSSPLSRISPSSQFLSSMHRYQ